MLDFSYTDVPGFIKYHEATVDAMTKIVDCKHLSERGAEYAWMAFNQMLYTLVDLGVIKESEYEKMTDDTKMALNKKVK